MAVNKNFVIKNGLEIASDVLVVSSENKSVGIGTTLGKVLLDVKGAIGATHLSVSGVATIVSLNSTNLTGTVGNIATLNSTNGTITNLSGTIGTITTLNSTNLTSTVGNITSLNSTNGTITNLSGTIGTITTLNSTNLSGTIGTIGSVQISSGIISASSGIVTYYGDGQFLSNVISGIGIRTEGSIIGYGITLVDFRGAGISTITYDSATGIGTINIVGGGGGGASISIGTVFSGVATDGNLWYKSDLGRLFIYYQDEDSAQWVDASPFNVGIITNLTNVSYNAGSAISPSIYFNGDPQTGWFSPGLGNQTFVSAGSSILNVNPAGVRVTGVVTATSLAVNIGTGITANSTGVNVTGVVTSTSLSVGGLTVSSLGVGIKTEGSVVGYGATMIDFRGAGISTITIDSNSGISTINITGGGGGGGGSYSTILALS